MENKRRIGIWVRVSTEFQVKDDSPEHHERRARMYAEAKGWEVVTVYRLEAISGKTVMELPETKKMLQDIKSGRITALVFSKLARLARNTRELLEFAELFQNANADLISLAENIDTSTPAGRLFFTILAAMAEWERAEIAERVKASVPIRAKMGKPLGGQASFGYRWLGKELVVDQHEGPVRKLLYELFKKHKRKGTVAKMLNEQGYRTRNGSKFTDTTVARLLMDPMAKGQRRANYTKSLGTGKNWSIKPETEWVITPCPALVDEELWDECYRILESQHSNRKIPTRKAINLFSGILFCHCGGKMYIPSRVKKYVCSDCKKTNISIDDIEEIYFDQLKNFLLTKNDLETFLIRANEAIENKQNELSILLKNKEQLKNEMDNLVKLHAKGQIPTDDFGSYYSPLSVQNKQMENSIIETEAQLDLIKMQQLNGDYILSQAESLYERWPQMDIASKRQIVEDLTRSITIGTEEIDIEFRFAPTTHLNTPGTQHNVSGS